MALAKHRLRYEGTRWAIVCDPRGEAERFALCELQRAVQHRVPYVVEIRGGDFGDLLRDRHLLVAGTPEGNPLLRDLIRRKSVARPRGSEAYSLACFASPWAPGCRVAAIAGSGSAGVLRGVADFCAQALRSDAPSDGAAQLREGLDRLAFFSRAEAPAIADRGIWTWGYVVYDYRRFLDNMARLRLNLLTVWNDCAPVNWADVVDYAHRRGIRVILGFPWGWGYEGLDLAKAADRRAIRDAVLADYRAHYRDLPSDGIYFQTLTEHHETRLGGRSVASLSCELVNEIARALLKDQPDLRIQFGLHASSIQDDFADLRPLDPRVTIVWEDAGVVPYSYAPVTRGEPAANAWSRRVNRSPRATTDYSRRLATFRGRSEFALVAKGWITLRWREEFEHHGPFVLGERDAGFVRGRLEEREPHWDRVNCQWLLEYPHAARFYRAMLACRPRRMTVSALVEDGLLEEAIQPSVALFAETVWDPRRADREILARALSPYYRRGW